MPQEIKYFLREKEYTIKWRPSFLFKCTAVSYGCITYPSNRLEYENAGSKWITSFIFWVSVIGKSMNQLPVFYASEKSFASCTRSDKVGVSTESLISFDEPGRSSLCGRIRSFWRSQVRGSMAKICFAPPPRTCKVSQSRCSPRSALSVMSNKNGRCS